MALVVVGGLAFTLPSGPLCDEGMILFMEGCCDWGDSNIFFFSKLGLLVALNLTFAAAWRLGVRRVTGFVPHLFVLAVLLVAERSGGYCDTYYSHPNGSIGQMVLECIGFALVGMSCLAVARKRTWVRLAVAILAWNASHVLIFYIGLTFTAMSPNCCPTQRNHAGQSSDQRRARTRAALGFKSYLPGYGTDPDGNQHDMTKLIVKL